MRLFGLCLVFLCSLVQADEAINSALIKQFLDRHSTFIMQKDEAKLKNLFADSYQQNDVNTPNIRLSKDDIVKIYKNNFMVSKLIINKINVLYEKISEDGQQVTLKTHIFNRYLIEFQGKQNILNQEEEWLSQLGLVQGQLVYLHTQKSFNTLP